MCAMISNVIFYSTSLQAVIVSDFLLPEVHLILSLGQLDPEHELVRGRLLAGWRRPLLEGSHASLLLGHRGLLVLLELWLPLLLLK